MELFHTVIQTNKDMKEKEVSVFVQHIVHVSVFQAFGSQILSDWRRLSIELASQSHPN